MLLMILFTSHRQSIWQLNQWFILPGGLLLRRAGWRRNRVRLQSFECSKCTLAACQLTRHAYSIAVSDGKTTQSLVATRRELEILLRAWLSPLEPPPLTRLSDFF